jgi:hypothetical protein
MIYRRVVRWKSAEVSEEHFLKIRIVGAGVQTRSTRHVGHWMSYCTYSGWFWRCRIWRNKDWQGKPKYSEKTYPSATLSTTNPTWPDRGSNPGRRGEKPPTNRLSYGAASSEEHANINLQVRKKKFKQETSLKQVTTRAGPPQRRLTFNGATWRYIAEDRYLYFG